MFTDSLNRLAVSLAIVVMILSFSFSDSAVADSRWLTTSFYLDNDLFSGQDDGYTNGIRISAVSPDVRDFETDKLLPPWLRKVNKGLNLFRKEDVDLTQRMVFTLGQQMYTPDEIYIDRNDLVIEDRPYAGWLYLGFGYQLSNAKRLDISVLNIGVVGPSSRAGDAQDTVHDFRGFDKFQGWDNQLRDEFGVQWLYTRKNKHRPPARESGLGYDVVSQWGWSLGNVATHLEAGAEVRWGWNLPHDFGTSSAGPGGDNSSPDSRDDSRVSEKWFGGIHTFIALNGRWVIHDISLDGNTFSDSHSVDKEPLVGIAAAGVAMSVYRFKLSFTRQYLTKQFKGQGGSSSFGSVSLSYTHNL